MPSLPIATQTLSSNDQVVFIGGNFGRAATQTHFNVDKGTNPWTWTPTVNNQSCSGSNCYNGYYTERQRCHALGHQSHRQQRLDLGERMATCNTIVEGGTIAYVTSYDQNAVR